MAEDERSSEARALAERALGRLLAAGAPTSEQLIVLGGLVPPTLTRTGAPEVPAHLGTTDVDVLLVTHLTIGHDLGPIENALEHMGFTPQAEGWRWSGQIEDRFVKIEFLCDLNDQPAEALIRPAGCSQLRAVNLRGTGYVERDHHEHTLHVPEGDLSVQIAGLAGYLLSKAASVRTRGADKDYYDFAYVLLHNNAGGPAAAANAIKASPLADALPGMGPHSLRYASGSATTVPMVRRPTLAKHERSPPRTMGNSSPPTPRRPSTSSLTSSQGHRTMSGGDAGRHSAIQYHESRSRSPWTPAKATFLATTTGPRPKPAYLCSQIAGPCQVWRASFRVVSEDAH